MTYVFTSDSISDYTGSKCRLSEWWIAVAKFKVLTYNSHGGLSKLWPAESGTITHKLYLSNDSLFLRSAKKMSLCKTWGRGPDIPNFDIRCHEWSSKPFCCFSPGELGSLTHQIKSWLKVSAGLKLRRSDLLPQPWIEPDSSDVQSIS